MDCPHFRMMSGEAGTNGGGIATATVIACSFCEDLKGPERFAVTEPDPDTGARYVFLTKHRSVAVDRTVSVSDSIKVDLDRNGDVIGLEILS